MKKFLLSIATVFLTMGAMAQNTLNQGDIVTVSNLKERTERKIAIRNIDSKNNHWFSATKNSETLTGSEVFFWIPVEGSDEMFYLKKACTAANEGYVILTNNATGQGGGAKSLGLGIKDDAMKFQADTPDYSGTPVNTAKTGEGEIVRFYNEDKSNWINCELANEIPSFRNNPGKGTFTIHNVYNMDAYKLLTTNYVKDGKTTTEYALLKEGDEITVPSYEGYESDYTPTTKDNTDTQVITVNYSKVAFYHLSGKNLTAAELMAKTEPTYIAIKGLANKNNEYWNYVSGEVNTSTEYFKQNAIFVWEPVNNGVAGSYYLRKLNSGYMQASNPGTYAETTEGAAVFTAVKPTEVASGANGSGQFNKDANSVGFIAAAGGYDYIVRLVTNGKWLNIGDRLTSAQAPAFNNGYGTFTIYQICELKGFEANINVTIKNTGDVDFATFYSNAPVQMPEGVTAYYVKEDGINDGYITLTADEDGIIAGNTGVILSTTSDADAEVALTVLGANVAAENGNLLKGTADDTIINEPAYVLGINDGEVGLYNASTTGQAEGAFLNNAGKAYLPASAVPVTAQGAANFSFRFEDGTTAIENVEVENEVKAIYDLTGRRVEAITAPGIYIVNGKKVLVK